MICREVTLPDSVPGKLYICQMPGRTGNWQRDRDTLVAIGADRVFCLTPLDEIRTEAAEYAREIEAKNLPWQQEMLPTPDFGVMADRGEFLDAVHHAAAMLQQGQTVMIQCGAGIGRSGTFVIATLMALGMPYHEAQQHADEAGSHPESWSQKEMISWVSEQLGQGPVA